MLSASLPFITSGEIIYQNQKTIIGGIKSSIGEYSYRHPRKHIHAMLCFALQNLTSLPLRFRDCNSRKNALNNKGNYV